MAKVTVSDDRLYTTAPGWTSVVGIGAVTGALVWLLTLLLTRFVIQPIVCDMLRVCGDTVAISGNVAAILGAVFGLTALIRWRARRPLLVVVAAVIALWGMAPWLYGLGWLESLTYSALLYALTYGVLYWLVRMRNLFVAGPLVILIAVAVRLI